MSAFIIHFHEFLPLGFSLICFCRYNSLNKLVTTSFGDGVLFVGDVDNESVEWLNDHKDKNQL